MDLQEALKFIPKGYSIKRCNWKDTYIIYAEGDTYISDNDNGIILSEEDQRASDWIVRWG